MLDLIPTNALVGIPGTVTIREVGLTTERFIRRGNTLAVHWKKGLSHEEGMKIRRQQLTSDIFLTSTNAVTEEGQLVNIDGAGNRVASMIFGPKKVIVIAGFNKIVKNVDEAINRIKNVATPMNSYKNSNKTPCAITGVCTECDSPNRACKITTILDRKPAMTDITIILVEEALGF